MKEHVTMACDVSHDMERHRRYWNNDVSGTAAGISCSHTFKCLNCKENYNIRESNFSSCLAKQAPSTVHLAYFSADITTFLYSISFATDSI